MLRSPHPLSFALIVLTTACAAQRPLVLERAPTRQAVDEPGWELSGGAHDRYAVHRDIDGNRTAWLLEPVRDTFGRYATWMRHIDAADYRAKRVRITATTKTEGATRRVDFWARAQAENSPGDGPGLGGDWKKLPANSGWQDDAIVMDVPSDAKWLEYGVGVAGPGKVWLESAKLEVVSADVPITEGRRRSDGRAPSKGVRGWILSGDDMPAYAISTDEAVRHGGVSSGTLRSVVAHPKGFGTLMQGSDPGPFLGKRVRMSAFVKADRVTKSAALWLRVDDARGGMAAFDNMENRPIQGTRDWARYEIVLDVASNAVELAFGILLDGSGQVWIDDVAFEVVSNDVPTTGKGTPPFNGPENLDFER